MHVVKISETAYLPGKPPIALGVIDYLEVFALLEAKKNTKIKKCIYVQGVPKLAYFSIAIDVI